MVGSSQKNVRKDNRRLILSLIWEHRPISRAKLARLSELNKSTVSSIVANLIDEKLVRETEKDVSTGGRRPILLDLNSAEYLIGAIDFDPEYSFIAIGNLEANILKKKAIKTNGQPASFVKHCFRQLLALKEEIQCPELKSIGISIPGMVNTKTHEVLFAPDLQWKNLSIADLIAQIDGDGLNGGVTIENEANASALAEKWFGKRSNGKSNLVFISEGIGTGIILNGRLVQGSFDKAGQFGHMTINPDGEPCICGNYGCWEVYACNSATVKRYSGHEFNGHTHSELLNIIAHAHDGDKKAITALEETGRYFGIGISNIIKAIDPEVVVIGGTISQAWDFIYPAIMTEIEKRVFADVRKDTFVEIVRTSLPERSSLIGALTLVIQQIFDGYPIPG